MNDRFVAQYVSDVLLGEGAFGQVYQVHNQRAEDYALKVLKPVRVGSHSKSLQGEVEILSRLQHPNLLKVFEYLPDVQVVQGISAKGPGYVMEWVQGPTLDEAIGPKTPWAQVEATFVQCLRGLHYLHGRHLIHGDLKPANLRVGAKDQVKLLDFGLASRLGDHSGEVLGTLDYLAPEALSGQRSTRSDLFSLGVIFFHLLTGAWPFDPEVELSQRFLLPPSRLQDFKTQAPPYFANILSRLLEPDANRRLSSAQNTLRALNQLSSETYELAEAQTAISTLERPPLVGRDRWLKKQEEQLNAWVQGQIKNPLCLIFGPAGIGRTRLVDATVWLAQIRGIEVKRPEDLSLKDFLDSAVPAGTQCTLLLLENLQDLSDVQWKLLLDYIGGFEVKGRNLGLLLEWRSGPKTHHFREAIQKLSKALDPWEVDLAPLDEAAVRELVQEVFFEGPIPSQNIQTLFRISMGNPALLLGLLKFCQEKGGWQFLQEDRHDWEFSRCPLPDSLRQAAGEVWQSYSELQKKLLASTYLFQGPVSLSTLVEALPLSLEELPRHLQPLLQMPWLTEDLGQLVPVSPPFGPYWQELLGKDVSRSLHAEWLQILRAANGADPYLLSQLAWGAEDFAAFREHGILAAQKCVDLSRPQEALEIYDDLLSVSPTTEQQTLIYAYQAAALARLARYDEALKAYDKWYRFTQDDGTDIQTIKYHYLTGAVYLNRGQIDKAKEKFELALTTGDSDRYEHHLPFHLKSLVLLGKVFEKQKKFTDAKQTYERGLQLARTDSTDKAQLLRNMGLLQQAQENFPEAKKHLEASLNMSERLSYDEGTANTAYVLANLSHQSGDYDTALKTYSRVLEIALKKQDPLKQARTLSNMAAVLVEIADYPRALELAEKAAPIFANKGTDWDRLLNGFHLRTIQTYLGNFHRLVDPTLNQLASRLQSHSLLGYLARMAGEAKRLQRDFQGALESCNEARKQFAAGADHKEWRLTLLHEILIECMAGDLKTAREKLLEWDQSPSDSPANELQEIHGMVSGLLSLTKAADDAWLQGKVQGVLKLGQQELVILTLLGSSEILTRIPDQAGADYLRRRAFEWLESLYRQLPEEMQLSFEHRDDFKHLAESRRQKLKATGLTRERFLSFAQINKRLSEETEMGSVLRQVMDAAMALAGAERGFLLLQDEGASPPIIPGFKVEAARNMKKENIADDEFKISLSVVEEALRRRVSILTDDAQADPNFKNAESVHLYQLKSIMVLPLVSDKGCIGALYLDHRFEVGAFSEERLLFLKAFADQAVLAIEKAKTLAELHTAKQALENRVVEQAHQIEQMEVQLKEARKGLKFGYEEIVGHSPNMMKTLKLLDRVTDTMVSVWIHGESGTGKELIARALHYNSDRKEHPFITENCSAIPENLLESVLFGHIKGAFTHADRDKMGLFEAANGGTIFLDEIGDMPMPMQSKLLRVLQEGEIRRVGSNESRPIDVRVVSATNKDLPRLVKTGHFREDLFFRLNGIKIALPPLRERKEDIPPLVHHFIQKVADENKLEPCGISEEALGVMAQYNWPGNIRELENAVRNAVLFADGQTITREALGFKPELFAPPTPRAAEPEISEHPEVKRPRTEQEAQREAILDALARASFHKGKAADELGVTPRHLYNLLEKYELPKNKWALKKLVEEERGFSEA